MAATWPLKLITELYGHEIFCKLQLIQGGGDDSLEIWIGYIIICVSWPDVIESISSRGVWPKWWGGPLYKVALIEAFLIRNDNWTLDQFRQLDDLIRMHWKFLWWCDPYDGWVGGGWVLHWGGNFHHGDPSCRPCIGIALLSLLGLWIESKY